MSLFNKKKPIVLRDPKELSLEVLSHLQASLIAKLIIVNAELIKRYETISDLSKDLNVNKSRNVLLAGAVDLRLFNIDLEKILNNIAKKPEEEIK